MRIRSTFSTLDATASQPDMSYCILVIQAPKPKTPRINVARAAGARDKSPVFWLYLSILESQCKEASVAVAAGRGWGVRGSGTGHGSGGSHRGQVS